MGELRSKQYKPLQTLFTEHNDDHRRLPALAIEPSLSCPPDLGRSFGWGKVSGNTALCDRSDERQQHLNATSACTYLITTISDPFSVRVFQVF